MLFLLKSNSINLCKPNLNLIYFDNQNISSVEVIKNSRYLLLCQMHNLLIYIENFQVII